MAQLRPLPWPPVAIRTERLLLRKPEARDRSVVIELLSSAQVATYTGGPATRTELEHAMPVLPLRRPGLFSVELNEAMIGAVTLDRRDAGRPGHLRPDAQEVELSYQFLPQVWGHGYATEACAAALRWIDGALPGEPVVLCTQTANLRSMRVAAKLGFTQVERFEEFGAQQWLGVRTAPAADCMPSFEAVLAADQAASSARLADLKRQFDRTVEASLDSNADDEHDPEGATIAYERAQLSALIEVTTQRLAQLDEAFRRLADGRYFECEICGGPIARARMAARPFARTCIGCAARPRR